jgi:hypothetical protein
MYNILGVVRFSAHRTVHTRCILKHVTLAKDQQSTHLQPGGGRFRGLLRRLAHAQVSHDLLESPQDGAELSRPLHAFDNLAHAGASDGTTAKDLARLVHDVLGVTCGLQLEQPNGPYQILHLLLVGNVVHLVRDVLYKRQHVVIV